MTPESQRIAIAEACEWKRRQFVNVHGVEVEDWLRGEGEVIYGTENLPDYLNDLNAMHEAEKMLTPEQRVIYWDRLQNVSEYSWHTTAAQRAEEFLRTLNLWKE